VDSIEESGSGRDEDDREAEPVAGVKGGRSEDKNESGVGRVTNEAEEPCFVHGLRGVDGDVGAEGAAEGDDGCPPDGETEDEGNERGGLSPGGVGVDGVGVGFAVVAAEGEGEEDDEPEDAEGASVMDVAAGGAGARDEEDGDFREDPGEVEDAVEGRYVHA